MAAFEALRINCGAPQDWLDGPGVRWQADREWTDGHAWGALGGSTVARESTLPILETARPDLYRTERYNLQAYRFLLEAGAYNLRMHFAETFDCNFQAGARSFDVAVNGRTVCERFDPFTEAGGFGRPVILEVTGCRLADGRLDMMFTKGALINGIEVERASAPADFHVRKTTRVCAPCERFIGRALPFDPNGRAYRALFIGNSGTFFWAVPESAQAMLATGQSAVRLEPHRSLFGGKTLAYHFDHTDAVRRIMEEGYDLVVLQEGTKANGADETQRYVARFAEVVRKAGARLVLYAYPGRLETSDDDRAAGMRLSAELAERHGALLVPACEAFLQARRQRPDITFHNADKVHLGMFGGYLMACAFYAVLSGRRVEGHPAPAVLSQQVAIAPDMAAFLQRAVDSAVARYPTLTRLT